MITMVEWLDSSKGLLSIFVTEILYFQFLDKTPHTDINFVYGKLRFDKDEQCLLGRLPNSKIRRFFNLIIQHDDCIFIWLNNRKTSQ